MGWLDEIRKAASQKANEEPPKVIIKTAPKPKPKIQCAFAQVRPSNGNDPGQVEEVYFYVEDNTVFVSDSAGEPLGPSHRLGLAETPAQAALFLTAKDRRDDKREFLRPLIYGRASIA